jgi:hypothetical protein
MQNSKFQIRRLYRRWVGCISDKLCSNPVVSTVSRSCLAFLFIFLYLLCTSRSIESRELINFSGLKFHLIDLLIDINDMRVELQPISYQFVVQLDMPLAHRVNGVSFILSSYPSIASFLTHLLSFHVCQDDGRDSVSTSTCWMSK